MARVTKYTCDECKHPISDLYGPMLIEVAGPREGLSLKAELCTWDCVKAWVEKQSEAM